MRKTVAPTLSLFSKILKGPFLLFVLQAAVLAACVSPPPYEEYTLASEAIRAAQEADGSKYSPAFWLEAERSYRAAEQAYKLNEFEKAKTMFVKARHAAERAENQSRLEKFKSGDVFQ
ncbi:MAG TPA: hypothetical protein DCL41_09990 [Bdellovibrionales bacterium]|nr:hypothetical protein [Pseudobdellovibrionaceae bacterium]HAG92194.1 hypothetical protein [Bdellovibrionales bacterium]